MAVLVEEINEGLSCQHHRMEGNDGESQHDDFKNIGRECAPQDDRNTVPGLDAGSEGEGDGDGYRSAVEKVLKHHTDATKGLGDVGKYLTDVRMWYPTEISLHYMAVECGKPYRSVFLDLMRTTRGSTATRVQGRFVAGNEVFGGRRRYLRRSPECLPVGKILDGARIVHRKYP